MEGPGKVASDRPQWNPKASDLIFSKIQQSSNSLKIRSKRSWVILRTRTAENLRDTITKGYNYVSPLCTCVTIDWQYTASAVIVSKYMAQAN